LKFVAPFALTPTIPPDKANRGSQFFGLTSPQDHNFPAQADKISAENHADLTATAWNDNFHKESIPFEHLPDRTPTLKNEPT
ncbi:MAG: hypothetical protein ACI814_004572, partial [Mariniblastus sp.]